MRDTFFITMLGCLLALSGLGNGTPVFMVLGAAAVLFGINELSKYDYWNESDD